MSAALESLHAAYPGRYITGVSCSCPAIYEHNPHVTELPQYERTIEMHYPLINSSGQRPVHFLQGYTRYLGDALGLPLECTVKRPYLYLSEEEKGWIPQVEGKFWLINAGYKSDYPVKKWRHSYFQAVVDGLPDITFVQVGERHHEHKPLRGVVDLLGKTDARQFIRLCYHAQGSVTPESYLHHIMGAFGKPCVTLASGFLVPSWVRYHTGVVLTHLDKMACSKDGMACGKSGFHGASKCLLPMYEEDTVAKCMDMIDPGDVMRALRQYHEGGKV